MIKRLLLVVVLLTGCTQSPTYLPAKDHLVPMVRLYSPDKHEYYGQLLYGETTGDRIGIRTPRAEVGSMPKAEVMAAVVSSDDPALVTSPSPTSTP